MPSRSVSPESATRAVKSKAKVTPKANLDSAITISKKALPEMGDGGIKKAGEEFNLVDLQNLEHHFFRISTLCLGIIFLMAVLGQIIVHVNIRTMEFNSAIVDRASRQRQLEQEQCKIASAIVMHAVRPGVNFPNTVDLIAEMQRVTTEFTDSHAFLVKAGDNSPLVHDALAAIAPSLNEMVSYSDNLLLLMPRDKCNESSSYEDCQLSSENIEVAIDYASKLYNVSNRLTPHMESLVTNMVRQFDNRVHGELDTVLYLTWGVVALVGLAVMVEGFKVFKPMMASLVGYATAALDGIENQKAQVAALAHEKNIGGECR
jgi:hypothetical protein